MKKIISFSLWGDNPKYYKGAYENVKLQQKLFPDWICRFYVHVSVPMHLYQPLAAEGAEIELVYTHIAEEPEYSTNGMHNGWFWRFDVLKDPDVERFIVRDADSRLSQREKNCVIDWTRSKKSFSIIRDNPMHGVPILAGTWGATREFAESIDYDNLLEEFIRNNKTNNTRYGGYDQFFLSTMFYHLIQDDVCIHDDYHLFNYETVRKIPHIRINNEFIGQPIEV